MDERDKLDARYQVILDAKTDACERHDWPALAAALPPRSLNYVCDWLARLCVNQAERVVTTDCGRNLYTVEPGVADDWLTTQAEKCGGVTYAADACRACIAANRRDLPAIVALAEPMFLATYGVDSLHRWIHEEACRAVEDEYFADLADLRVAA